MLAPIEDIVADFEFLDDWEDKYRYVIELGNALPAYPEEFRDEAHKVNGCVSQVWLHWTLDESQTPALIHFDGDSDAHIVRGLVAIMVAALSGKSVEAVRDFDVDALLAKIGLDSHLTPQRSNGLRAMVKRMKAAASASL